MSDSAKLPVAIWAAVKPALDEPRLVLRSFPLAAARQALFARLSLAVLAMTRTAISTRKSTIGTRKTIPSTVSIILCPVFEFTLSGFFIVE